MNRAMNNLDGGNYTNLKKANDDSKNMLDG